MAVQIVKPKAKVVSKDEMAQIVTPESVDEFASLKTAYDKKAAKLAPLKKQIDGLEKSILGAVDEIIDPAVKLTLPGHDYELIVGAQGERVSITDMESLADMLGPELFLKLATVSTSDLKAYLTPDQIEQVTKKTFAIKRRVKVEAI